jgi:hypothetical protein
MGFDLTLGFQCVAERKILNLVCAVKGRSSPLLMRREKVQPSMGPRYRLVLPSAGSCRAMGQFGPGFFLATGTAPTKLTMYQFAIDLLGRFGYSRPTPQGASSKRSLKISSQRSAISIQPEQTQNLALLKSLKSAPIWDALG